MLTYYFIIAAHLQGWVDIIENSQLFLPGLPPSESVSVVAEPKETEWDTGSRFSIRHALPAVDEVVADPVAVFHDQAPAGDRGDLDQACGWVVADEIA